MLSAAITFILQESSDGNIFLHLDPCLRKGALTKPLGKWHEPSDGTTGGPLTIWLVPGHNSITGTPRAHSPSAQKFNGEGVHHHGPGHSDSTVCATSCRAHLYPLLSALCSELVWNDLPNMVMAQPAAQSSMDNNMTRMINDILTAGLVPEWSRCSSSATKRKRLDREVLLTVWCVHPDSELWGRSCYRTVHALQCGVKLWTNPIKQTASADLLPSHSRIDNHAAEPLFCYKKQLLYLFKLEIPHSTCEIKKTNEKNPNNQTKNIPSWIPRREINVSWLSRYSTAIARLKGWLIHTLHTYQVILERAWAMYAWKFPIRFKSTLERVSPRPQEQMFVCTITVSCITYTTDFRDERGGYMALHSKWQWYSFQLCTSQNKQFLKKISEQNAK